MQIAIYRSQNPIESNWQSSIWLTGNKSLTFQTGFIVWTLDTEFHRNLFNCSDIKHVYRQATSLLSVHFCISHAAYLICQFLSVTQNAACLLATLFSVTFTIHSPTVYPLCEFVNFYFNRLCSRSPSNFFHFFIYCMITEQIWCYKLTFSKERWCTSPLPWPYTPGSGSTSCLLGICHYASSTRCASDKGAWRTFVA